MRIRCVLAVAGMVTLMLSACGQASTAEPEPTATVFPAVAAPGDIESTAAATDTVASEVMTVTEPVSVTEPILPSEPATDTVAASPVASAPTFVAATYTDEDTRIEIDYPAEWTVNDLGEVGGRGTAALLLSPGSSAEAIADGGGRVSLVTYVWDPKNDLNAWVAQRKMAWDASGFPILREEELALDDGRGARLFVIDSAGTQVVTLLTTAGEDYLDVTGEGDLLLAEEIVRTLRPIE